MLVRRLEVSGFLGRKEQLVLKFHEDLNIITGYNGAGKTNLLKMIWYTVSGNMYALIDELDFNTMVLETSEYKVNITRVSHHTCRGTFVVGEDVFEFEDEGGEFEDEIYDARDKFNEKLRSCGASLFFPTFRRIEGGFTVNGSRAQRGSSLFNASRNKGEVGEAVAAVSRRLSNQNHTFIASISTIDIAELLLRQFNEMSEEATSIQTSMSQDVIKKIRDFRRETASDGAEKMGEEAIETLQSIQNLIEDVDNRRERIMAPMRAVQELGTKIFRHKGIQINRRISFGDTVNAINSDLLSAGEKQMLSFICYNAFTDNAPIFIDEPELSLHVDWQRILFPTLESQKKNNQFIIATHSPFIYGKYPEKEIALAEYRGDEEI